MFKFLTERKERQADKKFRSEMYQTMNYLLGFAEQDFILKSLGDRPGLVEVGRKWRLDGVSSQTKGAEVLAVILAQNIEEMAPSRRARIVEDLRSTDKKSEDRDEFANMVLMFHTQMQFSGLDPEDRKRYTNDLFGALGGLTREERSRRRIERLYQDALLDSGWMCEFHGSASLIVEPLDEGPNYNLKCAACGGRLLREVDKEQVEAFRELNPEIEFRHI